MFGFNSQDSEIISLCAKRQVQAIHRNPSKFVHFYRYSQGYKWAIILKILRGTVPMYYDSNDKLNRLIYDGFFCDGSRGILK